SYDHDAIELWAVDVASKHTHQLTRGGAVDVEPRFSPDGKRIAFVSTSYNGHFHIFVGRFENGELIDVQRVTGENRSSLRRYYYSQFDHEISPRWSPDGRQIAFISNRGGNTSLYLQAVSGGAQTQLVIKERHYLKPVGHLGIKVLDPAGHPTAARIFITGEDGRAYAPDNAWINADDNFDRSERRFEAHYFHSSGNAEVTVPAGRVEVEVMKGFEYRFEKRAVQ